MFVYNIAAKCDLCSVREQYEEKQFNASVPIKLEIPKGWRLIGIDSEGKHANLLVCEDHDEINVREALAKIPAPSATNGPTIIPTPKR